MQILKTYILSIIIIITIITLSIMPTNPDSDNPLFNIENIDKIIHGIMYFGLTMVLAMDYFRKKSYELKKMIVLAVLILLFSISMEILQYFIISWRSGDYKDVFANFFGIVIGCILLRTKTIKTLNKLRSFL